MSLSKSYLLGERGLLEELCYQTGAPVNGINFTKREEGWLLVVKARSASRGPLVAFFGGHDPDECLEALWALAGSKPGVNWKPDKFAKE